MILDIKKYNIKPSGVVHVGAHFGQEVPEYKRMGAKKIILIEPQAHCIDRLNKLQDVTVVHSACGSVIGEMTMYTSDQNEGQSNSLLRPKLHEKQHPEIKFTGSITVPVVPLDMIAPADCDMLVMDVQGYELEVLRGAQESLKNFKWVYTEVNRDETYEGCARVEEIDAFLSDFQRVETSWLGIWGDALYIRKQEGMITIPHEFQPHQLVNYPPDNRLPFEEWFSLNLPSGCTGGRVPLPIHWTAYYVQHKYGKDPVAIDKLQQFLNSLDPTKKYYTAVQYDDGILNDLRHLDIKIFGMGGGYMDYALPLVCQPHAYHTSGIRYIFANFIGRDTHPIRKQIFKFNNKRGWFVTARPMPVPMFCNKLHQSIFTLAPRGYGPTSFRIVEAMQYGSIPVYISDHFIEPFGLNFDDYGVKITPDQIPMMESILKQVDTRAKQAAINAIYPNFTYEGCKLFISQTLNKDAT